MIRRNHALGFTVFIAVLLSPLAVLSQDMEISGPLLVVVWNSGKWIHVESIEDKHGSIIYQKPGGYPIAATENSVDRKTTKAVNQALQVLSDACSGAQQDLRIIFELGGRSRKIFFSIAENQFSSCVRRLHDQYQRSKNAVEEPRSGSDLSDFARNQKLSGIQDGGVVIDNRTVGSLLGVMAEEYRKVMTSYDEAFSRLRGVVIRINETPEVFFDDSWRSEILASMDVMEDACEGVRQASPPSSFRDIHELIVSAANDVDRYCELMRTGFETGDDALFSQAATHLEASRKKISQLNKQIELTSQPISAESPGVSTADLYSNTEELIYAKCSAEWPDDHRMQLRCREMQEEGLRTLRTRDRYSAEINLSVFAGIRAKCREEWPSDFRMRNRCEEMQIEAYKKLQGTNDE